MVMTKNENDAILAATARDLDRARGCILSIVELIGGPEVAKAVGQQFDYDLALGQSRRMVEAAVQDIRAGAEARERLAFALGDKAADRPMLDLLDEVITAASLPIRPKDAPGKQPATPKPEAKRGRSR